MRSPLLQVKWYNVQYSDHSLNSCPIQTKYQCRMIKTITNFTFMTNKYAFKEGLPFKTYLLWYLNIHSMIRNPHASFPKWEFYILECLASNLLPSSIRNDPEQLCVFPPKWQGKSPISNWHVSISWKRYLDLRIKKAFLNCTCTGIVINKFTGTHCFFITFFQPLFTIFILQSKDKGGILSLTRSRGHLLF